MVCAMTAIVFGCRKNDIDNGNGGSGGTPPDTTSIPTAENINTEIVGYVTNEQNQVINSTLLFHLLNGEQSMNSWNIMGNGIFSTGNIVVDKYGTNTLVESGSFDYLNTLHSVPFTNSTRNYVRIKTLTANQIGTVRNDQGGVLALPNGGSITFGINTFYQTPTAIYPGYFGPEIVSKVFSTYLDPEHAEFGMRLPKYLAGDENQQRKFLESYGVITMRMYKDGWTGDNIDFYGGGTAELKLPITAGMQAGAPDSIPTWYLSAGKWRKGGWAKKQGNFYTARIGKVTAWNFAVPEKGVYMTVNLRTDSSATLTNTAVRIKTSNRVIAEGRTDADGNAMFFVPTHQALIAEVLPAENVYSPNKYAIPAGTLTKATTVPLKIPSATPELGTLVVNVYNCNGQPVANGMAKIQLDALGNEYTVPVKNGRFATSLWIYGTNNGIRLQVTDFATGNIGDNTAAVLFSGDLQNINLYACTNATQLYSNYTFNNNSYALRDDAASSVVNMTATKPTMASPVAIKTTIGNIGFDFNTWVTWQGITTGLITDLKLNGVIYPYDPMNPPVISFTRFDPHINGYLEGSLQIWYKDGTVTKQAKGNFKVKKLF